MDGWRKERKDVLGLQDGASRQPMEARADLSTRPCIPVCPLAWGIRELVERQRETCKRSERARGFEFVL